LAASKKSSVAPRRVSFAKIREPLEVPNLLALQVESVDWLLGNDAWRSRIAASDSMNRGEIPTTSGLEEIFEEISPIELCLSHSAITVSSHLSTQLMSAKSAI
jgi:DNA-directed RNA polymerase subunit beta